MSQRRSSVSASAVAGVVAPASALPAAPAVAVSDGLRPQSLLR